MPGFASIFFAGLLFVALAQGAPTTHRPAPAAVVPVVPVAVVPPVPVVVVTTPPPAIELPLTTPAPEAAPLFNLTDTLFRLSNRTDRARDQLVRLQEVFSKSGLRGVAKEIGIIASHPVEDNFLLRSIEETGRDDDDHEADGEHLGELDTDDEVGRQDDGEQDKDDIPDFSDEVSREN